MRFTTKLLQITASAVTFSLCLLLTAGAAEPQAGVVTENGLRLRAAPSASSSILALASKGNLVSVLSSQGSDWYQVSFQGQEGYMSSCYVSLTEDPAPSYAFANTGSAGLNLRSGPGTSYAVVKTVTAGTVMPIVASADGWYQVTCDDITGYVCGDYIQVMSEAEAQEATQNKSVTDTAAPLGEQIAQCAQDYLGYPYVYGTAGPSSFDCSGFTSYIYAKFGYTLNRTSYDQIKNGTSVALSNLQPGDLLFFKCNGTSSISHVGIYVGDGQFIHSSTNTYSVRIDTLAASYYSTAFAGACRVVG